MLDTRPAANDTTARRLKRLGVSVGAALAAVAVFVIAVPVLGLDVTVPERPGADERVPLEIGAVLPAAVIASFAGWAFLALLERVSARPLAIWTPVALVVYVASLPYLPGFDFTERLTLTLMHSALTAVLIVGLWKTSPNGGPRR